MKELDIIPNRFALQRKFYVKTSNINFVQICCKSLGKQSKYIIIYIKKTLVLLKYKK